jgi:hypothetical protein
MELPPVLYGLDCEMCETTADSRALVRMCLVDMEGKTVLDVSPSKSLQAHVPAFTCVHLFCQDAHLCVPEHPCCSGCLHV